MNKNLQKSVEKDIKKSIGATKSYKTIRRRYATNLGAIMGGSAGLASGISTKNPIKGLIGAGIGGSLGGIAGANQARRLKRKESKQLAISATRQLESAIDVMRERQKTAKVIEKLKQISKSDAPQTRQEPNYLGSIFSQGESQ